jgi:hypothetical protein
MKSPLFASYGAIAAATALAATVVAACEPVELAVDVARVELGAALAGPVDAAASRRTPALPSAAAGMRPGPAAVPARPRT